MWLVLRQLLHVLVLRVCCLGLAGMQAGLFHSAVYGFAASDCSVSIVSLPLAVALRGSQLLCSTG